MAPVVKDRRSNDEKSSVRQPPKKAGGGGKYTMGKPGEYEGGATMDSRDPNYDPDEWRTDPDDGVAYKFADLAAFYKGKFSKQAVAEYWEYECKPVKRKSKKAAGAEKSKFGQGPSLQESAAKAKYVVKGSQKLAGPRAVSEKDPSPDGALAKEVAKVIPYYPYKKLEKFYDVQGLLHHPNLFDAVCTVMAKKFRKMGVTKLCAFEARGFLFSLVSVKLNVPFVMLRKAGKMPNTISSEPYTKEYEGVDTMCIQRGAIVEGDKVVLLDDLIATGGTLCAGIELIKACKAEVTECACMVELKDLKGRDRCIKAGAKAVWGFISEELLTTKADLPTDYVDDGKK